MNGLQKATELEKKKEKRNQPRSLELFAVLQCIAKMFMLFNLAFHIYILNSLKY